MQYEQLFSLQAGKQTQNTVQIWGVFCLLFASTICFWTKSYHGNHWIGFEWIHTVRWREHGSCYRVRTCTLWTKWRCCWCRSTRLCSNHLFALTSNRQLESSSITQFWRKRYVILPRHWGYIRLWKWLQTILNQLQVSNLCWMFACTYQSFSKFNSKITTSKSIYLGTKF